MTLIGILVALLCERLLGHLPGWGEPTLFRSYVRTLHRLLPMPALWRGALAIPIVLAPPVAVTGWLSGTIEHPLVEPVLSAVILLLCLGPRDLADDVKQWLDARAAGDRATAERLARTLQQGPGRYSEHDVPEARGLLGALFIQSHERLFGVLLWFAVGGVTGAVFYRLVSRLPRLLVEQDEDSPAADAAETLHALAAWIPARVTALLFGLAGSLDDAIKEWRLLLSRPAHGWRRHTWAVLAETASGSLEFETEDGATEVPATLELAVKEVLAIQMRALLILLAFIAAAVTGDWLG
ncbi:MAG TPA: regulatory signaling modulator protein AmpE [Nevskiaceae bacterium]|nr:regulatory signaling modulator protein AmpE [Nevskiaceae bacterium]